MISFDLECTQGHRFEGIFKDYHSFNEQLKNGLIICPICDSTSIKRLYTGCSIQAKPSQPELKSEAAPNIFEALRALENYVKENFENVGRDFTEVSRAMYYGLEEEKNIYGESTHEEISELREEGINVFTLPDLDKLEN